VLAETDPEPLQAPIHHLPLQRQVHGETLSYYEYRLTEVQVQSLIDAVQKINEHHNPGRSNRALTLADRDDDFNRGRG